MSFEIILYPNGTNCRYFNVNQTAQRLLSPEQP